MADDDVDPMVEMVNLLNAQRREYGQYIANQNIYVGNALAHTDGHQVPASNVERYGWLEEGLVSVVPQTGPADGHPGEVITIPPVGQ